MKRKLNKFYKWLNRYSKSYKRSKSKKKKKSNRVKRKRRELVVSLKIFQKRFLREIKAFSDLKFQI